MCEYVEGCTKVDDPAAVALWKRRRTDASLLGVCPERKHVLAAVFALPSGPHVVTRPWPVLAKTMFLQAEPAKRIHVHAGCEPLEADTQWVGRCDHGMWMFTGKRLTEPWGDRSGMPYALPNGPVMPADHPASRNAREQRGT